MVTLVHFSGVFGDLVDEEGPGVDVLGPRLTVEGHRVAVLRKKLDFALLFVSLNWIGAVQHLLLVCHDRSL